MRLLVSASLLLGFSVLGLSLMGASAPQILLSERFNPAATADSSNRAGLARQHVALHIINGFSAEEEANIIAAVVDWNQAGAVHLDVAALNYTAVEPGAWSIVKLDGGNLSPLVSTHRISADGGSIAVNVNRMAAGDLRRVIGNELDRAIGSTGELANSPPSTAR